MQIGRFILEKAVEEIWSAQRLRYNKRTG